MESTHHIFKSAAVSQHRSDARRAAEMRVRHNRREFWFMVTVCALIVAPFIIRSLV